MGMLMKSSDSSLIEFHFYNHQVLIVGPNLTNYYLTGIFPLDISSYLIVINLLFHNQNLTVNSSFMSLLSISYANS